MTHRLILQNPKLSTIVDEENRKKTFVDLCTDDVCQLRTSLSKPKEYGIQCKRNDIRCILHTDYDSSVSG